MKINNNLLRKLIKESLDDISSTHDIEILDLPTDKHSYADSRNNLLKNKLLNLKNKLQKEKNLFRKDIIKELNSLLQML